jgi:hypothetical protein
VRLYRIGFMVALALFIGACGDLSPTIAGSADNVTTTCDHGNRVYIDHTAGAIAVVPQDPTCAAK